MFYVQYIEYKLYQLDKTGYQRHQSGVMNVLHERPIAHKNGMFDQQPEPSNQKPVFPLKTGFSLHCNQYPAPLFR